MNSVLLGKTLILDYDEAAHHIRAAQHKIGWPLAVVITPLIRTHAQSRISRRWLANQPFQPSAGGDVSRWQRGIISFTGIFLA